jgi:nitroreductase
MSKRRSIRRFSSIPIEKKILMNAIRTAGTAPSGANRQPWFFALITDPIIKGKIRTAAEQVETEFYGVKATSEWLRDLKPFGTTPSKPYLSEAPALIAVFTRAHLEGKNGEHLRTYYPIESTGIAVGLLLTALHHSGLATLTHTPRPMNFLNEVLGLDRTYRPFMIVITGKPALPIQVPDLTRKPLTEIMKEY